MSQLEILQPASLSDHFLLSVCSDWKGLLSHMAGGHYQNKSQAKVLHNHEMKQGSNSLKVSVGPFLNVDKATKRCLARIKCCCTNSRDVAQKDELRQRPQLLLVSLTGQ